VAKMPKKYKKITLSILLIYTNSFAHAEESTLASPFWDKYFTQKAPANYQKENITKNSNTTAIVQIEKPNEKKINNKETATIEAKENISIKKNNEEKPIENLQQKIADTEPTIQPLPIIENNENIKPISQWGSSDEFYILNIKFFKKTESPKIFTVTQPNRIILEFEETEVFGLDISSNKIQQPNIIEKVKSSTQNGKTRFVLYLKDNLKYYTSLENNQFSLYINKNEKNISEKIEINNIKINRTKTNDAEITIQANNKIDLPQITRENKKLILKFPNTLITEKIQKEMDVSDYGTNVDFINTKQNENNSEVIIMPNRPWDYMVEINDDVYKIKINSLQSEQDKADQLEPEQVYTGEKMTINFQNIPIREALSVIADFTGLNIVISDSINGNATLRLKDVPWDQALHILLENRGLEAKRIGNVLQIATKAELAAKEKELLTSQQEITDLEHTKTNSFVLNYQKAQDVANLLSNEKQKILSKKGSATADLKTNILFVQDVPSRLEEVKNLIKQIDIPSKQVMVEAKIIIANDTFGRSIGSKIMSGAQIGNGKVRILGQPQAGQPIAFTGATGTNVNLPNNSGGLGGAFTVALFNAAGTSLLGLEISAMENEKKGKIVSSPHIITADKVEAKIEQGQQIPYQQSSANGSTTVDFKQAALTLKVTPQITPDGHIIMSVDVSKDALNGTAVNGVPIIDVNKVKTEVLVENGGTIVLGGVYTESDDKQIDKVPFFGDIPGIGNLFKRTTKNNSKNELLIFITPKIIDDYKKQ